MTPATTTESASHPAAKLVFGCAGMGGYAGYICDLLLGESLRPDGPVHLAAVCDPRPGDHPQLLDRLKKADVKVFGSYSEMLRESLEAVWLPLPIHLHRSTTELALNAGIVVMCEKPVAGSVDDLDAIIAARDRTGRPVAVGYQDIYDPATLRLKQQLLAGDIGTITQVVLRAGWPRDDKYYSRNDWAGSLRNGTTWVLDSPANNALAHFLNLALFLAGPSLKHSADPDSIDAELYRVNKIENFDTCALRVTTRQDSALLIMLTHACEINFGPFIEIRGTKGKVIYTAHSDYKVILSGEEETVVISQNIHAGMVDRFTRYVRGTLGNDLVATLETSRPPLIVINGASEATFIHDVPSESTGSVDTRDGGHLRFIQGIERTFEECGQLFQLPNETGLFPWTRPHGSRDLRGYSHFIGPRATI